MLNNTKKPVPPGIQGTPNDVGLSGNRRYMGPPASSGGGGQDSALGGTRRQIGPPISQTPGGGKPAPGGRPGGGRWRRNAQGLGGRRGRPGYQPNPAAQVGGGLSGRIGGQGPNAGMTRGEVRSRNQGIRSENRAAGRPVRTGIPGQSRNARGLGGGPTFGDLSTGWRPGDQTGLPGLAGGILGGGRMAARAPMLSPSIGGGQSLGSKGQVGPFLR